MESRPRSDIYTNLPALEKLDNMLIQSMKNSLLPNFNFNVSHHGDYVGIASEPMCLIGLDIMSNDIPKNEPVLDFIKNFSSYFIDFEKTEFRYVDEGSDSPSPKISSSFRRVIHRNDEKWWLPIPRVPDFGLNEKSRKELEKKKECANQIHKAAMAINSSILAEMAMPKSYLSTLPKSGKMSTGDSLYRYMSTTDKFSANYLLDCLDINSEYEALELADRVEAAIYIWRCKATMIGSKSSWDFVKDLMADGDKNVTLASRAESLLLCLKQRYPALSQTTLDSSKIQYNKGISY